MSVYLFNVCKHCQQFRFCQRTKIIGSCQLIEIISLPLQLRQDLPDIRNTNDGLICDRSNDERRHCQPARFDFFVYQFLLLCRNSESIGKRSRSVSYNFPPYNFTIHAEIFKGGFISPVKKITTKTTSRKNMRKQIFRESSFGVLGVSPNEATCKVGVWQAKCVPRYPLQTTFLSWFSFPKQRCSNSVFYRLVMLKPELFGAKIVALQPYNPC